MKLKTKLEDYNNTIFTHEQKLKLIELNKRLEVETNKREIEDLQDYINIITRLAIANLRRRRPNGKRIY